MHIPDNYLSPSSCAVLVLLTAPVWIASVKRVSRDFPKERVSALGVAAALSFLAMMFNVPLPGGTTGHAVGGTLLAILLGPEAACLALTIALAIQALLFGDGGVLAFGANCFNMAFILPFGGRLVYDLLRKATRTADGTKGDLVCVALASYAGINLAALAAGVEFGIQPALFHTPEGQALYCPYPLAVSIPAMAIGHLTVFGLAEAFFSVFVYAFVRKTAPDFAASSVFASKASDGTEPESATGAEPTFRFGSLYLLVAILALISPLGLIAEGTAWGEWGADEIASVSTNGEELGYTPEGMTNGFEWSSLIPDYSAPGIPDWLGYILSAVAGVALCVVLFKLATLLPSRSDAAVRK